MIKILILCGGSGTRLWPISRTMLPKQFAPLLPHKTLFQKTLKRASDLLTTLHQRNPIQSEIAIITHQNHYFLAQEQSEEIGCKIDTFILEDSPRDSAPALILSAMTMQPEDILLVFSSDHIIKDFSAFVANVEEAIHFAQKKKIVIFGITPTYPHTGYGYIHARKNEVLEFCEKPSLQKAQEFLKKGDYFWNSGLFCFQAQTFLQECQIHQPKLFQKSLEIFQNAQKEHNFIRLKGMEELPKISIDYALIEKTSHIAMIKANFRWNDVGSFDSLQEEFESDANGNITQVPCYTKDSKNNFILSSKPVSLIGIESLTIVDTKDALLIAQKGQSQYIKELISQIKDKNLLHTHSLVYRPWGSYEVLEEGRFYKIKKIIVKPKKRLSLQKHFHRNEHWIIIKGSALIQIDSKEIFLQSNQSTYIPMGSPHRLSNPGQLDLVMIEVQVGEYVGEDDILRLEDDFHRA